MHNARAPSPYWIRITDAVQVGCPRGQLCTAVGLVGLGGLEPPTSRLSGAYSNQLSYRPYATASTGIVAESEGQNSPRKNQGRQKICNISLPDMLV